MKKIVLDCNRDYILAVKIDGKNIEDFFALRNDTNLGDVFIGRVENIRGNQCFVNYDITRKNGIMETKGKTYKSGDFIKCQIIREEMDDKGAILSSKINLAGNFAVLCSNLKGFKFSHKLSQDKIKVLSASLDNIQYGFIIRKHAGEVSSEAVKDEIQKLSVVYKNIEDTKENGKICCVYSQNAIEKALSEVNPFGYKIITNSTQNLGIDCEFYDGLLPIIDFYDLRTGINEFFDKRIELSCGIELIFEQTEAMHIIDVNLKGYFGGKNSSANKLAAKEIVRQVRLRNLSGLIMVDFVTTPKIVELVEYVNTLLLEDREKAGAVAVQDFSIVAINRKKRYNIFKSLFFGRCECCNGIGEKKSLQYQCQEIVEDTLRLYGNMKFKSILISLGSELFEEIKNGNYDFYLKNLPKQAEVYIKYNGRQEGYQLEITDEKSLPVDAFRI